MLTDIQKIVNFRAIMGTVSIETTKYANVMNKWERTRL